MTATASRHREPANLGPYALAGVASLGAGAVHAAAIGVHGEHPQAARVFAVLALAQIVWGVIALAARRPLVALSGLGLGVVAIAGWVMAKTVGIGFIDGLDVKEPVQWPDLVAALLALGSIVAIARVALADAAASQVAADPLEWSRDGLAAPAPSGAPGRRLMGATSGAVVVLAMVGMTTAGTHRHVHSGTATESHDGHVHGAPAVPTKEYDPNLPIDLSGVAGVTPREQARAENLVAETVIRLPQFADYKVAEARGFRSIGDGLTGHEHFINWSYISDDHILDPDYPESLVYVPEPNGGRKLVSAMFMLKAGTTLDDVPDVGGALTQWHIHDDLCFSNDPIAPHVAGLTNVGGTCPPPTVKLQPVPMIHVWITKNPCGPFAALEGVGAGQIKPGQTRLCDHVHGSGL